MGAVNDLVVAGAGLLATWTSFPPTSAPHYQSLNLSLLHKRNVQPNQIFVRFTLNN